MDNVLSGLSWEVFLNYLDDSYCFLEKLGRAYPKTMYGISEVERG